MQCLTIPTCRWFSSFKRHVLLAAMLAGILSASIPAEAGLLIDIALNSAAPGATGSLEVTLTNTGSGSPSDPPFFLVGGFSFEITATGTDVTFSDVTTGTSLFPYIFPATYSEFGPDIVLSVSPDGHTIIASDNYFDATTATVGTTLSPGETVSLGLVSYSLSNSTPLVPIPISFMASTDVSDPSGTDLPVTRSSSGSINVLVVGTVSEPSSLISMLLGAFGIGFGMYRRRSLVRPFSLRDAINDANANTGDCDTITGNSSTDNGG